MPARAEVVWDSLSGFARFAGPGGFTEFRVSREEAEAIAHVFGVPFRLAGDPAVPR